jgi:mitogen-activated protein kinase organizer 1
VFSHLFIYHFCFITLHYLLVFDIADGKYCFTGCHDRTVRLWNPARLDPAVRPPPFTKKDDSGDISLEHLPHALPIQTYEVRHAPSALATNTTKSNSSSSTRSLLVASDRTAVLFDVVTTQVLRRFQGHHTSVINCVAIAGEDINVYASGSYDATVALWDGRSNSPRPIQILKDAKDSVTVVDFLKENGKIRSASVDGCVRTYDIRNGCVYVDDYGSPITGITRTDIDSFAEQYLAVSCLDGTIRVHVDQDDERGNNGDQNGIIKHPALICYGKHLAGQYALACSFTADGCSVATGSQDGRAVLYDVRSLSMSMPSSVIDSSSCSSPPVQSASVALELVGHTSPTCSIATNPIAENNDLIITASYDGQAVVWANSREYMKWEA